MRTVLTLAAFAAAFWWSVLTHHWWSATFYLTAANIFAGLRLYNHLKGETDA